MPSHRFALSLLALVALATVATAEEQTRPAEDPELAKGIFVCTASRVLELGDDGALKDTDFAKAIAMYEARFAVDRKTGMAMGGSFGTWDAKDVQVLSPGNDNEAFKVLYLANTEYAHLKYLLVKSYLEGEKKPFLGITGSVVLTGTCE